MEPTSTTRTPSPYQKHVGYSSLHKTRASEHKRTWPKCATPCGLSHACVSNSDELSAIRHCSQANECELRRQWRKCGEFSQQLDCNSMPNRNPSKVETPHFNTRTHWLKHVPYQVPSQPGKCGASSTSNANCCVTVFVTSHPCLLVASQQCSKWKHGDGMFK